MYKESDIQIGEKVPLKYKNQFVLEWVNLTDGRTHEEPYVSPGEDEWRPFISMLHEFSWMQYEIFWYDENGTKYFTNIKKKGNYEKTYL